MPDKFKMNLSRLCRSMEKHRLILQVYRENHVEAVREYLGDNYSENGSRRPIFLNLIALYVSVVGRNLISKNPRQMLSTFDREAKPTVATMMAWSNMEIEKMNLDDTLRDCVVNALFSMGICQVALATPQDAATVGWGLKAGHPYACPIDIDDFVCDMKAKRFADCSYIGHRYRVPLDSVKYDSDYGPERKNLTASTNDPFNEQGDERINILGRSYYDNEEDAEPMVDLWQIYLPRHRQVITLSDGQFKGAASWDQPLRTQNWIGPACGPYHILGYGHVPSNLIPKAPIMDLLNLHRSTNNYLRKIDRQARRLKKLTVVRQQSGEDAKKVNDASDGDTIGLANPEAVIALITGGADQALQAMASMFKEMFSWQAGNLDIMGGLSPQSKTAHQDAMLNENSARSISDMQATTIKFTAGIMDALDWYWWHHPTLTMRDEMKLPGGGASIMREATPIDRMQSNWDDIKRKVDPYSMQAQTPQSRLAAINQVVQQIYLPLAQLAQQQGVQFDFGVYLTKVAQYLDEPDLQDILTIAPPPSPEGESGGGQAGVENPPMPAQTNRTYTRESMPGRTQQGNDMMMRNHLMGVDMGGAPQQANGQAPMVGGQ